MDGGTGLDLAPGAGSSLVVPGTRLGMPLATIRSVSRLPPAQAAAELAAY